MHLADIFADFTHLVPFRVNPFTRFSCSSLIRSRRSSAVYQFRCRCKQTGAFLSRDCDRTRSSVELYAWGLCCFVMWRHFCPPIEWRRFTPTEDVNCMPPALFNGNRKLSTVRNPVLSTTSVYWRNRRSLIDDYVIAALFIVTGGLLWAMFTIIAYYRAFYWQSAQSQLSSAVGRWMEVIRAIDYLQAHICVCIVSSPQTSMATSLRFSLGTQ